MNADAITYNIFCVCLYIFLLILKGTEHLMYSRLYFFYGVMHVIHSVVYVIMYLYRRSSNRIIIIQGHYN